MTSMNCSVNSYEEDTINQMEIVVAGMIGRRIMYKDLVSGEDGRMNFIESKTNPQSVEKQKDRIKKKLKL